MESTIDTNPLLMFQLEAQLRQRILQELQLLLHGSVTKPVTSPSSFKSSQQRPNAILRERLQKLDQSQLEGTANHRCLHDSLLGDSQEDTHPPAALIILEESKASQRLLSPGTSSVLLPYSHDKTPSDESSSTDRLCGLPQHRIPVYSLAEIFRVQGASEDNVNPPHSTGEVRESSPSAGESSSAPPARERPKKGKSQYPFPQNWSELLEAQPELHARESAMAAEFLLEARDILRTLSTSRIERDATSASAPHLGAEALDKTSAALPAAVLIPSHTIRTVPLLKALWRWRMWVGEGWSGDGFGVLEATGREKQ